jgi:hypothetical protein
MTLYSRAFDMNEGAVHVLFCSIFAGESPTYANNCAGKISRK